jgi:hypothetical protein
MERLARALAARREELLEAAMASILERVPGYRTADAALLADVRGHVGVQYDLFRTVLARGRPVQPREMEFIARHAALRARRGISLVEFLEAFRCFHNVMWDAIVADGGDEALPGARALMTFVDFATTLAGTAYVEAQQLLVADGDRVRRDLLEDLLEGAPPSTAAGLAVAREAGLEGDARCLVVAAVPVAPAEEDAELRRAASRLGRALGPRALAVTRHAEVVVVVGERPAPGRALAPVAAGLAVGVSTPHGVGELGDAYR